MKVTYLNHEIDVNTPSYGNRDKVDIKPNSLIADGDTSNSQTWSFSINHIGTHIDVPRHFYEGGKTITDLEPCDWIFESVSVVNIPCKIAKLITVEDFKNVDIEHNVELLFIRTGYEQFRLSDKYWKSYPGISSDACKWLRSKFSKLRGVGFDFISLTSPKFKEEGKKAHQVLLDQSPGKFVLIIEDMKLEHLDFIPSKVIVSPVIVKKADGSPATIYAIKD